MPRTTLTRCPLLALALIMLTLPAQAGLGYKVPGSVSAPGGGACPGSLPPPPANAGQVAAPGAPASATPSVPSPPTSGGAPAAPDAPKAPASLTAPGAPSTPGRPGHIKAPGVPGAPGSAGFTVTPGASDAPDPPRLEASGVRGNGGFTGPSFGLQDQAGWQRVWSQAQAGTLGQVMIDGRLMKAEKTRSDLVTLAPVEGEWSSANPGWTLIRWDLPPFGEGGRPNYVIYKNLNTTLNYQFEFYTD